MTEETHPEPTPESFAPPERPKLRMVEAQPVELDGQAMVALRDPAWPPDRVVLLSHAAVALIGLFDGERDLRGVAEEFAQRYGEPLDTEVVGSVVAQLDEALLLDSARYRAELETRRAAFRVGPLRPMTMADECYAAGAEAARAELDSFYELPDGPGRLPEPGAGPALSGIIAPHIDYERGAALYGHAYLRVAEGAADAELFVLLGTDHRGEVDAPFSLTALDYETPFGPLATDAALVRSLCARMPELRDGELAHGREHSLEFQAVMLHHALGHRPKLRVLPVLCGLLTDRQGRQTAERQAHIESFIEALAGLRRERRVCFIAGADLAHLGPAFGTAPLSKADHRALECEDAATLELLCDADADGFRQDVDAGGNPRHVCGLSAIYTLLRALEPASGTLLGYRQCPVPGEDGGGSRVSIAAVSYP